MNKPSRAFWVGILFCSLLSLYFLFVVPTFDLDESLYRRVAEEMKLRGAMWNPTWDTRPLFHKPPILYWLIEFFSNIVDGMNAMVSSTAARMPGFVVGVALTFALGWARSMYLWLAMFPLITICSVIYDPLQTLALLPAILIPHQWFREEREGSSREYLTVGLSLFVACAIKGLNGLIVPAIAITFQLALQHWSGGFKGIVRSKLKFVLRSFVPATILSAIYYWWLDQKMGHGFTYEFFMVHHFGRSQEAMESHGGGILYYPVALALCCGALFPFLLSSIASLKSTDKGGTRRNYIREGYPLTFALAFVVVFSFSATKLPHYLWPVFPALAVFAAGQMRKPLGRVALLLSFLPILFFTLVAFASAFNPVALIHFFVQSQVVDAVLPAGSALPLLGRLGMAAAAALGALLLFRRERFVQRPDLTFAASSIMAFLFAISITPFLVDRIHKPIVAIANDLTSLNPPANTCMWYSGPSSPSLSLALGHSVYQRNCEPQDMNFLIAPNWKIAECAERGMVIIAHEDYLNLCEKAAGGVGVMSGKPGIPVEVALGHPVAAGEGGAPLNAPEGSAASTGTLTAPALAGPDGIAGTEDDLYVTASAGPDGVMGTADDVVTTQFAGPDKIGGTADDVPTTAATLDFESKPKPMARSKKKVNITHLGLQSGEEVNVMNFVGADGVEGTSDDVSIVRAAGPDHRLNTPDDLVVTQYAGPDKIFGTEDDLVVTQSAGPDNIPGTEDDVVVTRTVGPDKIAGTEDDVPANAATQAVARAKGTRPNSKPKISYIGPKEAPTAVVSTYAGPDGKFGTEDDVLVTRDAGPDHQLNTGDDLLTTATIGPDQMPGTEDDIYYTQQVGPDKIPNTEDDTVTAMAVGTDKIAGTEDDLPVANPLSTALGSALSKTHKAAAKKSAGHKNQKPKVTHIGLGTANEAVVMNFAGEDGVEGTRDDYSVTRKVRGAKGSKQYGPPVISFAGEDGKLGTADDVVVTQRVGDDHIAGTADDVVVTKLAGSDKIPETADDVPVGTTALGQAASEVSGSPDRPTTAGAQSKRTHISGKNGKIQHIGLNKSNQVTVMNFADENAVDMTSGKVSGIYVVTDLDKKKASGKMSKAEAKKAAAVTQEVIDSLNEMAVTQQVGADKAPGTLDDLVVVKFAGPDGVLGTPDDVNATTKTPLPGQDGKPGTADDQIISQFVGPDHIAGTADDVVMVRTAGPDKKFGTADDIVETHTISESVAAAPVAEKGETSSDKKAAGEKKATADKKAAAASSPSKPVASLFPKPAVSRTARPVLKKVSTQIKPDSPAKVKKATFDRTAATIDWQIERMDYCEAYLCDDKYQSERVIENIETLIDEFPDAQFTGKQLEMLNTALIKAVEYKKNWKKYTPDYEIGLMSQEQVDDAITPLINRLRNVISVVKKRQR